MDTTDSGTPHITNKRGKNYKATSYIHVHVYPAALVFILGLDLIQNGGHVLMGTFRI